MSALHVEAMTAVQIASRAPLPIMARIAVMQAAGAVALLPAEPAPGAAQLCADALRDAAQAMVRELIAADAQAPEQTRLALLRALRVLSWRVYRESRRSVTAVEVRP